MNAIVDFPVASTINSFTQLELEYDSELQTVFSWMRPSPRPCFTATLLEEVRQFERLLEANSGHINNRGKQERVSYLVAGSKAVGAFNLGGDLEMFIQAILRRDRELLTYYGHLCIENVHRRLTGFGSNIPTIALVQDKCFGGGFECALTSEVIVAERAATFSFPEVMFNLIPGMGALHLLKRRVGMKKAEQIIMSGRVYSAADMHELGVVDVITEVGLGLETTKSLIRQRQRKAVAYSALYQAKQVCEAIPKQELLDVVDVWVTAAMRLETRDLRMMSRLLRGQNRLLKSDSDEAGIDEFLDSAQMVAAGGGD